MVHVPYKGASETLPALIADQVQMSIVALMGALPLLAAKQIKALVTSGAKRFPDIPDTPTFAEAGYPQLDFQVWFGLMTRKGTPQPVIDKLAELSSLYVNTDEFRNVLAARYRWTPLGDRSRISPRSSSATARPTAGRSSLPRFRSPTDRRTAAHPRRRVNRAPPPVARNCLWHAGRAAIKRLQSTAPFESLNWRRIG